MLRRVPPLMILVSACGFAPSQPADSSVTIRLPPPKDAVAPGFSSNLRDPSPAKPDGSASG